MRITLAAALAPALAIPGRAISTTDRIVVEGSSYRVIAWGLAASGTLLRVVARR